MKKILKSILLIFTIVIFLTACSSKSDHIKEITLDDYKEKISNKETFALYIGNEGCSHCMSYKPTLEEVLNENNIDIYWIDNSKAENKELASYINISGTPTVLFITDGIEETTLNRIVGEISKEDTIEYFKTNGYIK